MGNRKNEKTKINTKGITLIALVITIIVLLILAGVSIATLTGENGILTRAQDAAIETRASQVEEIVELWKTEIEMNEAYDNGNGTVKSEEELLQGLLDEKQVYENEIDRENKIIKIGDRVISYKTKLQLTDIYVALYNDGTLVFNNKNEFDTSKLAEGWTIENIKGKKYEIVSDPKTGGIDFSKLPQWFMNETITKVDFKNKIVPEYTSCWFVYLSNLSAIENISNLDTSNVTNMLCMFYGCSRLTSINLQGLDTSNVTDMNSMFSNCNGLTSINLQGLDTSNVTNMSNMFYGCDGLTSINLERIDTSKVTNMKYMFYGCDGLTSIDVSGFNTSNVTVMNGMFYNCNGLTSINLERIDTSKVTNMQYMFNNCSGLTSIDVSGFNTSNVTDMYGMFSNCSGLTSIDVSGFNTSNVTDMNGMFSNCSGLTSIDVSRFNTSNVTDMINMFGGCTSLAKLDVSNFDITYMKNNPTRVQRMFQGITGNVTISSEWTDEMKEESKYKEL